MSNSDLVLTPQLNFPIIPTVLVHGTEATAPSAATVLADSGQLSPGSYKAWISFATTDTAANLLQIAHRNAANNADVELADFATGVAAGEKAGGWAEAFFVSVAQNERVVVRNKNAGTSSLFYQVNLHLFLLT